MIKILMNDIILREYRDDFGYIEEDSIRTAIYYVLNETLVDRLDGYIDDPNIEGRILSNLLNVRSFTINLARPWMQESIPGDIIVYQVFLTDNLKNQIDIPIEFYYSEDELDYVGPGHSYDPSTYDLDYKLYDDLVDEYIDKIISR